MCWVVELPSVLQIRRWYHHVEHFKCPPVTLILHIIVKFRVHIISPRVLLGYFESNISVIYLKCLLEGVFNPGQFGWTMDMLYSTSRIGPNHSSNGPIFLLLYPLGLLKAQKLQISQKADDLVWSSSKMEKSAVPLIYCTKFYPDFFASLSNLTQNPSKNNIY